MAVSVLSWKEKCWKEDAKGAGFNGGNNRNQTKIEQIHSLPHMWRSGVVPSCDIYKLGLKSA